jgi:hypothetical protein
VYGLRQLLHRLEKPLHKKLGVDINHVRDPAYSCDVEIYVDGLKVTSVLL